MLFFVQAGAVPTENMVPMNSTDMQYQPMSLPPLPNSTSQIDQEFTQINQQFEHLSLQYQNQQYEYTADGTIAQPQNDYNTGNDYTESDSMNHYGQQKMYEQHQQSDIYGQSQHNDLSGGNLISYSEDQQQQQQQQQMYQQSNFSDPFASSNYGSEVNFSISLNHFKMH